jgi:hypothetical protein
MKILKKIKCFFGFHENEKWDVYPGIEPKIKIDRCKICGYYEWR